MPPPVEPTEVLWSEWDGELEIDSDRHLGLDEIDRARLQGRRDLRHELVGKKYKLRQRASRLELAQESLVLGREVEGDGGSLEAKPLSWSMCSGSAPT